MKSKVITPNLEDDLEAAELPEGWVLLSLDKIGKWRTGGTPSRKVYTYFGGNIPWVKSGDLKDGIVTSTEEKITESGVQNCAAKILPAGTVTVALYGATIGKVGILGIDAATNQACANCIIDPKLISKEFLFYFILAQRRQLIAAGQGGAQPNLTNQIIHEWPIPLPPLDEQQYIVARVETLLTNVNSAREQLNRVPLIMKKFRQAVLGAACSGRLTEGWRDGNPSTETSDQLEEQVIQELQNISAKNKKNSVVQLTQWNAPEPLELLEIPENWTWIAVKDATTRMQYGISVKSDSDEKSGYPILRMGNIQEGSIDLTDLKYIPPNTESISNFIIETEDILFNRTNSPELVGKSAVYKENLSVVFASYLVRIRPNSNLILSDYLCWWINSTWGREWAQIVRTDGVSQSNINAQKLSVMPVPLPPLAEQHEIVRRVGMLFERADAIDREVAAAGRRCERLTQAVLAKAFAGKL